MQSTESVKHVEITTPCFPESTGNEVMMIPVFDALSELLGCLDVGWIRLFPESPTGIEAWVWKRIRRNKIRASRFTRLRTLEKIGERERELEEVIIMFVGDLIQPILRRSRVLTMRLLETYADRLNRIREKTVLFSANFQAFEIINKWIRYFCIGIDLCPEYKVGRASRRFKKHVQVLTACGRAKRGFMSMGVDEANIHNIGLPISSELANVVDSRKEKQRKEGGLGKVLVQLGGTGTEIDFVLDVIKKLREDRQEVIVLCGDNTDISKELRVKAIDQGVPKKDIYGGTDKTTRDDFQNRLLEQ